MWYMRVCGGWCEMEDPLMFIVCGGGDDGVCEME